MEEAENAVREIGTAAMDAVQGLDSATLEGTMPFIVGVLILLIVVKFFALPFKLVWNGIIGAVALWLVNLVLWLVNLVGALFGFGLKITVVKALIAGVFGVPGLLAVLCWEIFIK